MARPAKKGLDYFPLDVNIFDNEKVAAVSGEFKLKGEIILIKLLCAIYKNGYFYEWSEMNRMHLLRQLPGVTPGLLEQVIDRLVRWGFFDKSLFDSSNILTSAGIQERYFTATARRKSLNKDFPYLLINANNNPVNVCNNPSKVALMPTESTQIKRKEIKTPLNLPTRGSINHGFSAPKEEGEHLASLLGGKENENRKTVPEIPKQVAFQDGVQRNYEGLLERMEELSIPQEARAEVILLSNYGEIGHPIWKILYDIRNAGGKIKMPANFLLSRLAVEIKGY